MGSRGEQESELRAVDEAQRTRGLGALSQLLDSKWEQVAVKAALALAALCARDESLQAGLGVGVEG